MDKNVTILLGWSPEGTVKYYPFHNKSAVI